MIQSSAFGRLSLVNVSMPADYLDTLKRGAEVITLFKGT
jgi:hypothetical protein